MKYDTSTVDYSSIYNCGSPRNETELSVCENG